MNLTEVKILSYHEELYEVYENNYGREFPGESSVLMPVSHSTAQAQIEIILKDNGSLVNASVVSKDDATTIIPVTEDSGARSSGICPMPFADKLIYIAGDFNQYGFGKYAENSEYYTQYMDGLKKWKDSQYSHPALKAVWLYLEKSTVISDLIRIGILTADENSGKLKEKVKISDIFQEDSFVRFRVNYSDNINHENRTWLDESLYESFINYNKTLLKDIQLCYASGTIQPVTYKHPSKIRNIGDKAKLISSNDESGFSYRGRFDNKEQAVSVGYEYSQKIHNALRWLISKQGGAVGSMNVIIWASAMQDIPNEILTLKKSDHDVFFSEFFCDENELPDTEPRHREMLDKLIFGYSNSYIPNSKIMLMGVDAATTGRLSVSMYSEFESSLFYANIKQWHADTSCFRFNYTHKKSLINSFSLYEIADCAFGTEQDGKLICREEVRRDNILRLIPCVTEGRNLPSDIVLSLVRKASNPLSYEKRYNHRTVLEAACGMIKKYNLQQKKINLLRGGITTMAYDPNETNRSYLYGCLLAVADKAESSTYDEKDRDTRQTNARRYWSSFALRPCLTWKNIYEKLRPYLDRSDYRKYYEGLITEIKAKMNMKDFADNSPLEPSYLIGYHHFMDYMYTKNNKNHEE